MRKPTEGPPATAFELAKAWPGSELVVIENGGRSTADQGMAEAIIAAANRFADGA